MTLLPPIDSEVDYFPPFREQPVRALVARYVEVDHDDDPDTPAIDLPVLLVTPSHDDPAPPVPGGPCVELIGVRHRDELSSDAERWHVGYWA